MAEISEAAPAIDSSPRKFVAFGRLLGGLAISVVGALGLHFSNDPDVTAFASVATVAGAVLNIWGFIGTVLHAQATREDCFWAIAFFLLFCGVLAGNVYYNNMDYGIRYVGVEIIIVAAVFLFAWVSAIVSRLILRKNSELSIPDRRRRMLIIGIIGLPLYWLAMRPPILAEYHVRTYGISKLYGREDHIRILEQLPTWCVRSAVAGKLHGTDLLQVDGAMRLLLFSERLSKMFGPDEYLKLEREFEKNDKLKEQARQLYEWHTGERRRMH
jgi:hypothetical protein